MLAAGSALAAQAASDDACRECAANMGRSAYSTAEALFPTIKKARSMGSKLLSFFGSGDYTLKHNSLVDGGGVASDNLRITYGNNDREVRIIYREYLQDIVTSTDGSFKLDVFDLQPTNDKTFPWLSGIAGHWDQFTINGCMFEFKSTASDSNTGNRSIGSVMLATEYDIFDGVYPDKQVMMNSAYANESKVSAHVLHGIECAKGDTFNPIMFTGAPPTGADPRDYSLGLFQIATVGGSTGNADNVGSLYVHYDITFRKEQIPPAISTGAVGVVNFTPAASDWVGTVGLTTLDGMNIEFTKDGTDSADIEWDVVTGKTYAVYASFLDVGANAVGPTFNESELDFVTADSSFGFSNNPQTANGRLTKIGFYTAIKTGRGRFNAAGSTSFSPGGTTQGSFTVYQMN